MILNKPWTWGMQHKVLWISSIEKYIGNISYVKWPGFIHINRSNDARIIIYAKLSYLMKCIIFINLCLNYLAYILRYSIIGYNESSLLYNKARMIRENCSCPTFLYFCVDSFVYDRLCEMKFSKMICFYYVSKTH